MAYTELRDFLIHRQNNLSKHEKKRVYEGVLQYILDNKNINLDTAASKILEQSFSPGTVTKATRILARSIATNFHLRVDEENPEFLQYSKKALYQLATERGLQFTAHEKRHITSDYNKNRWFGRAYPLHNTPKDDIGNITQCLKWLNCVTEFYFGARLFQEKTPIRDFEKQLVTLGLKDKDTDLIGNETDPNVLDQVSDEEVIYQIQQDKYSESNLHK